MRYSLACATTKACEGHWMTRVSGRGEGSNGRWWSCISVNSCNVMCCSCCWSEMLVYDVCSGVIVGSMLAQCCFVWLYWVAFGKWMMSNAPNVYPFDRNLSVILTSTS